MGRAVVRGKGQITIPSEIRKAARLEEGDPVEVELVAEGILLKPRKLVDSTQAWFWSPTWQAREREADEDLAAGRTRVFADGEALLAALDAERDKTSRDSSVPTCEAVESFWRDWRELTPEEKDAFRRAVEKLVHDLGAGTLRAGLRVKRVEGTSDIFELTWANDGRATFEYGTEREPGEPHVIWRRIGTHAVLENP